jgi:hypothetical protein
MSEQLASIAVNVPANGEIALNITGQFLSVTEASSSDFDIALGDDAVWIVFDKGIRYALPNGERFSRVRFRDRSGATNTLRVYYGDGLFDDNRVSISGSVVIGAAVEIATPTTVTTTADQSVPNAVATQVLAANAGRKLAIVQNKGTAAIRVGDSNVAAARGVELASGASWEVATTAALYVYQASGSALTIAANEVDQ